MLARVQAVLLYLLQRLREPVEAFVEAFTVGGAGGLDVPVPVTERVEVQFVGDFCGGHGVWEILLVGEDKENGVPELILGKHPCKFLPSFSDTFTVVRVDNEDETLSVLEVVTPQRPDFVLATHIPHCEGNVFILNSFDVEACGIAVGRMVVERTRQHDYLRKEENTFP